MELHHVLARCTCFTLNCHAVATHAEVQSAVALTVQSHRVQRECVLSCSNDSHNEKCSVYHLGASPALVWY